MYCGLGQVVGLFFFAKLTIIVHVQGPTTEKIAVKNDHRPVNVDPSDLLAFAWPVTAYASIIHRFAGVFLFAAIGLGLFALDLSLSSEAGFNQLKLWINTPLGLVLTWLSLSALAYHFVAGIKHLLLDLGIGETLEGARLGAKLTLSLALIFILLTAGWLFTG